MHRPDPLVITSFKNIGSQYILWVVICYREHISILPSFRFLTADSLCNLDINLLIQPCGDKINLCSIKFANIHIVATMPQLQINDIFQHTCYGILIVTQYTESKCRISKIEFFLGFEYLFTLDIIALTSMKNIGTFQFVQVTVYRFRVHLSILAFEILRQSQG